MAFEDRVEALRQDRRRLAEEEAARRTGHAEALLSSFNRHFGPAKTRILAFCEDMRHSASWRAVFGPENGNDSFRFSDAMVYGCFSSVLKFESSNASEMVLSDCEVVEQKELHGQVDGHEMACEFTIGYDPDIGSYLVTFTSRTESGVERQSCSEHENGGVARVLASAEDTVSSFVADVLDRHEVRNDIAGTSPRP